MFQSLSVKDVNAVHLVCGNLHQIANLYVNPKLSLDDKDSSKDLESLVQSSRIFEELEFHKGCGDYLLLPAKFDILGEYLGFTGPHIKKLVISKVKVDLNFLKDLKDLRLEHLEYESSEYGNVSLEFLRQLVDLKFLRLDIYNFSHEALNPIWELKNLESFELDGGTHDSDSGLNNLHKLGKMKKLKVDEDICWNILDHLKFGVYQNLKELDASFDGASLETIREMKRITPNLKKLVIQSADSDTINPMVEALENLEEVEIQYYSWELTGKVYPKIKHIYIDCGVNSTFSAAQFIQQFPNLEYLKLNYCRIEVTESFFFELLSGLKHLKTLEMEIMSASLVDPEPILQHFQEHGKNLEGANIVFEFPRSEALKHFAPGDSFRINKTNFSFNASWMWK